MSETITHTLVMDDCFRLLLAGEEICETFRDTLVHCKSFARLGAVTRSGDSFSAALLSKYREHYLKEKLDEPMRHRLAFVLGWLSHRAADRQMKPVFREADAGSKLSPTDCSIYHDTFLFREVYMRQADNPFHPAAFQPELEGLAASAAIRTKDFEAFFKALLQRSLLELHTFNPDKGDIEGWLDRLFSLQQDFYIRIERYAEAIWQPDAEKVKRYITDIDFYDANEPIIAVARALALNGTVTGDQVSSALQVQPHSHYAQALTLSCRYIMAASEFFIGRIDEKELELCLDIGKPGRDGKWV